jgi:hypothetical protein
MNRNVLIVGGTAVAAYVLGTRANRPTLAEHPETLRHQVERLWTDPKAKKHRVKFRKQRAKDARKALTNLRKQTEQAKKKVRSAITA